MIRCNDVYKSFSGKTVLSGIDFEIGDGEIFGLLGPSGAGKTTLIRILTGQLSFDKGLVTVFDKDISSLSGEDKKSIGIMMDQFGVYETVFHKAVFCNVYRYGTFDIGSINHIRGKGKEHLKSTDNGKC